MVRKIFAILLIGIMTLLAMLHPRYGLGYISRVYLHQESDWDDFTWKPALAIAKPNVAKAIPVRPAEDAVRTAFAMDPLIDDLDVFMANHGTTALIVVKGGRVIYENHYNGHTRGQIVGTFSVSKSFFSVLVGRALAHEPTLDMSDPISRYIPELAERDERFSVVTLSHLIDMRSGIAFAKQASFPFFDADEPLVYYATDLRKHLIKYPKIESAPGSFHYGDYNPNLLALALERSAGKSLDTQAFAALWQALGAEYDALWSTDYRGFPLVESGLAAAPIDMAKLGIEMLKVGNGADDALVPQSWHARSTQPESQTAGSTHDGRNWEYRNGWWLLARPSGTSDYAAIGHLGQYIYVSPIHNVVIVRTGLHRGKVQDDDFTSIFYGVAERF